MAPTIDIKCPVPSCEYKPPTNLSEKAQERALARHTGLRHTLADLPGVVEAMATEQNGLDAPTEPAEAPSEPVEAPTEPAETPRTERVNVQSKVTKVNTNGSGQPSKGLSLMPPEDPKKARIEARAKEWGGFLYKDFNPLLVETTKKLAGIPDPWMTGGPGPDGTAITVGLPPDGSKTATFWSPPLQEQLALSESECEKLAKAGANFAESPMGQALVMWAEHNAHFIALGAALWVAGTYGWKVMRIKTEVAALQEMVKQQQAMQGPQDATNTAAA